MVVWRIEGQLTCHAKGAFLILIIAMRIANAFQVNSNLPYSNNVCNIVAPAMMGSGSLYLDQIERFLPILKGD